MRLRVEADRGADADDADGEDLAGTPAGNDVSTHTVLVDGRKVPAEVKCNGAFVSPVSKPSTSTEVKRKSATPVVINGNMAENSPKVDAKLNGHVDGDASGSDSEHGGDEDSDHSDGKAPASETVVRATRSGRVPAASTRNGKLKKRKKKGVAHRTLMDLGQWDATLVVGLNVLDIKIGGQGGESWRIFVDRTV